MRKRAPGYLLDREELPFTEEEIFRAMALLWPKHIARKLANHLAIVAPGYVRFRARRRAEWRRHGAPHSGPLGGWAYPDELLPLLTLVSPAAAERVERFMAAEWERERDRLLLDERVKAARRAGLIPTLQQIRAQLRAAGIDPDEPAMSGGLAVGGPPLPEATSVMQVAADAKLRRRIRGWRATCRRLRREVERRHHRARGLTSS